MGHLQMLFNLLDAVAPLAMRPGDIILKPLLDIHLPVSILKHNAQRGLFICGKYKKKNLFDFD